VYIVEQRPTRGGGRDGRGPGADRELYVADVVLANAVRNPETWRTVVEALAARGLAFEDIACVQVPRLVPARAWAGHAAALASGGLRLGRVVRRV